jgi:hypothetical protein
MSLQEELDRINREYQNAANAAAHWSGVNAQAQHDAHKVMQSLVDQRNAAIEASRQAPPPPPPPPPSGPNPAPAPTATQVAAAPSPSPPPPPPPVKIPDRDVLNFTRNDISATGIATLLFENVGAVEASILTRRDTVEGQNPYYTLISNLATIKTQYDATQLISRQKPNQSLFDVYSIDLNSKIPGDKYLRERNLENFFYIANNGDLIIELDNVGPEENVQLQIAGGGTIKMVSES